ncbi:unnamed protein product [Rotaria sordida]|uniref:Uncharacterized protein n=1 Tax=Rotaria sordida TaxID=392033 RepID=A0A819HL12_9BILA|nr:unnamed protein product [Rotaria sordida]CAF1416138.1 unnamed protein product [Rotaria sordida]CAF3781230.1 unnamed protein product [Rotaria sordida]CAF3902654.1 unnamed protein product [Rotaria sordida]
MASIPCSPRRSVSNMKDLQNLFQSPLISYVSSSSTTPPLQYFNMRVTERLHRYRSLKRHWYEVATAVQHKSSSPPKVDSPLPFPDITPFIQEQIVESKVNDVKDYITPTTIALKESNDKNSIEINPLHSQIQRDLIELRKLMKTRQKRHIEIIASKTNTYNQQFGETLINPVFDDQENNNTINTRRSSSLNKAKLYDRTKISGSPLRPSTFPQSNSIERTNVTRNNSLNTSPQNSKQQQKTKQKVHSKTFSICRSQIHGTLSSDSIEHRTVSSKKKSNTPPKITSNTDLKQTQPYRLSMPPVLKKKESSFIKQEILLPPIRRSSIIEQTTTRPYNYAASTSSATPSSMKINRNQSLLPILLTSVSCIGIQPQENHYETHEENDDDDDDDDDDGDYYNLLHYKQLINHLPKPIISIRPRYNQDDYGILFEQLDHIRERMPDSHVYDNYTRIY